MIESFNNSNQFKKSNKEIYDNVSHWARMRSILRTSWNGNYTGSSYNGKKRRIGGFRATQNAGDYLSRVNFACKGPNPLSNMVFTGGINKMRDGIKQNCDDEGVPVSSTNVKYVYDSSIYTRYHKQKAYNPIYATEK
jgi:hypothetical protein|tara:strand:+ start:5640 stop:6050 length:411 start_codon:yes stop_codon:yes gene_type:complete